MKILQVVPAFIRIRFGGIKILSFYLSVELARRGHDVTIYASDYRSGKEEMASLQHSGVNIRLFKTWLNLDGIRITPGMVGRSAEIRNFDVIHLHNYRTFQNAIVHYYAKKYNIPYALQSEGSLLTFFSKGMLKRAFDNLWGRGMLRDAARVIAASRMEAEQYRRIGVAESKIGIVPFGIDPADFDDLPGKGEFRNKYGLNKDQRLVLYLGRIHKIKGLDLLAAAFAELAMPTDDIRLAIVGPDDGYLPSLRRTVSTLGIDKRVIFTGPLYGREKLEAYVDADVYVLPSVYEDFGVTVLEACACGAPVVITDRCGAADVIEGGIGLVVPYDKSRLRDALLHMLTDDKLRRESGEKGRLLVREKYGWDKIAAQMEKIYRECLR